MNVCIICNYLLSSRLPLITIHQNRGNLMSNKQSEQVSTIYSDSMPITETNTEELCKYIFTQCFIPVASSDTDCQDRKYDISE